MLQETLLSFRQAGLGIKRVGAPLQPGNRGIFQLDIRASTNGEYFRLWPGATDNEFSVLDADRSHRQVVLRVREPRRPFEQAVTKNSWLTRRGVEEDARRAGGRILREDARRWIVQRWTPEAERRYLCGFDERSLFIVQILDGGTVAEAHLSLKPAEVREAELRWPSRIARQGEWFFLPTLQLEEARMLEYGVTHPRCVRKQEALGAGGSPHVADEVVRVDRRERRGRREVRFRDVYLRGRVLHRDHREVRFDSWRRVVHNRAVEPAQPDRQRLRWID
jgi:hypothetical protein